MFVRTRKKRSLIITHFIFALLVYEHQGQNDLKRKKDREKICHSCTEGFSERRLATNRSDTREIINTQLSIIFMSLLKCKENIKEKSLWVRLKLFCPFSIIQNTFISVAFCRLCKVISPKTTSQCFPYFQTSHKRMLGISDTWPMWNTRPISWS